MPYWKDDCCVSHQGYAPPGSHFHTQYEATVHSYSPSGGVSTGPAPDWCIPRCYSSIIYVGFFVIGLALLIFGSISGEWYNIIDNRIQIEYTVGAFTVCLKQHPCDSMGFSEVACKGNQSLIPHYGCFSTNDEIFKKFDWCPKAEEVTVYSVVQPLAGHGHMLFISIGCASFSLLMAFLSIFFPTYHPWQVTFLYLMSGLAASGISLAMGIISFSSLGGPNIDNYNQDIRTCVSGGWGDTPVGTGLPLVLSGGGIIGIMSSVFACLRKCCWDEDFEHDAEMYKNKGCCSSGLFFTRHRSTHQHSSSVNNEDMQKLFGEK